VPPPLHQIPGSDITITAAGLFGASDAANTWVIDTLITPPGGEPFPWTFIHPEDTLEKRSAEYQLTGHPPGEMLAMLLYEAFVPGEVSTTHPHALWNAPDTATARAHYLTAVTTARGKGKLGHGPHPPPRPRSTILGSVPLLDTAAEPDDPLTLLTREMAPHPGRVAVFTDHIQTRLAAHRAQRTAPDRAALRRRPTPEELRHTLRSNTTQTSQ
jgi:hypothetical protein